ncbi:MAG: transglutaminase-like domain-containing protein [Ilumatobacteraceae bacterium]
MGRERFAELMAGDSDELALDEASLLISASLQPDLDLIEWLAALDLFAGDCATPTPDGVARHLFETEHFTGNRQAYYDWRNSCLDRVIATRTGIPITLAVVMIEVARRVGVKLVGVGMPAHFLVRVADDPDVFFDPFDRGRRLDRAGARAIFESVTRGQVPWRDEFLEPTADRDIVIRMLNNLKSVFAGRADTVRLGLVMGLRDEIDELSDTEGPEIARATAIFN